MSLFDAPAVQDNVDLEYNQIHVRKATFKAGLGAKVHRWFRLTPSFGPDLVRLMLDDMCATKQEVILDPFAGASTTVIESRLEGYRSFGYEINPLLHFVGRTSLNWSLNAAHLTACLAAIADDYETLINRFNDTHPSQLPYTLPTIHNVYRWWRADVLRRLVLLRECIGKVADQATRDFFFLCLAGALVPDLTNVTLGRLQLHFIDRSGDNIDVWGTYKRHATLMIDDMRSLAELRNIPDATLIHGDSVDFTPNKLACKVDLVVTSPPYPNRYSYVWNTRPHLYMLGFFNGKSEGSDLDKRTIGGTWGTATSMLMKGVTAPYSRAVEEVVGPVVASIRKNDLLMSNYCMHYFNKMTEHLTNLLPHLNQGARVAYVVGCSRLSDVFVETDVLLSRIFGELGLQNHRIHRFRKRNSGKDLHESTVYATLT